MKIMGITLMSLLVCLFVGEGHMQSFKHTKRGETVNLTCPIFATQWYIWNNKTVVNSRYLINPSLQSYDRLSIVNNTGNLHLRIENVSDYDATIYFCGHLLDETSITLSLLGPIELTPNDEGDFIPSTIGRKYTATITGCSDTVNITWSYVDAIETTLTLYTISSTLTRCSNGRLDQEQNLNRFPHPHLTGNSMRVHIATDQPKAFLISVGTITFPANYSLKGSSDMGFVNKSFTWTCKTESLGPNNAAVFGVKWTRGHLDSGPNFKKTVALVGTQQDTCTVETGADEKYIYNCSDDGDFTLTIPPRAMTRSEHNIWWRCCFYSELDSTIYGSKYRQLKIIGIEEVNITSMIIEPNSVVNITAEVNITCELSSMDYKDIIWTKDTHNEIMVLQNVTRTLKTTLNLPSTSCLDIGYYTCEVRSEIDVLDSKTKELIVYCAPTMLDCALGNKIIQAVRNAQLNITVIIIANPTPSVDILKEVENDSYNISLAPAIKIVHNSVFHTVTFINERITIMDLGPYYLYSKNMMGSSTCKISIDMLEEPGGTVATSTNNGIAVGAAIGGIVLLSAVIFTVVFLARRKFHKIPNESSSQGQNHEDERAYNEINIQELGRNDQNYTALFATNENTSYDQANERDERESGGYEEPRPREVNRYIDVVDSGAYQNTVLS